jgi:hypothetical protein
VHEHDLTLAHRRLLERIVRRDEGLRDRARFDPGQH